MGLTVGQQYYYASIILRIIGHKFGENNEDAHKHIIIELLGTKMGECNEICQTLS